MDIFICLFIVNRKIQNCSRLHLAQLGKHFGHFQPGMTLIPFNSGVIRFPSFFFAFWILYRLNTLIQNNNFSLVLGAFYPQVHIGLNHKNSSSIIFFQIIFSISLFFFKLLFVKNFLIEFIELNIKQTKIFHFIFLQLISISLFYL